MLSKQKWFLEVWFMLALSARASSLLAWWFGGCKWFSVAQVSQVESDDHQPTMMAFSGPFFHG
jgi:hypothetical protein